MTDCLCSLCTSPFELHIVQPPDNPIPGLLVQRPLPARDLPVFMHLCRMWYFVWWFSVTGTPQGMHSVTRRSVGITLFLPLP